MATPAAKASPVAKTTSRKGAARNGGRDQPASVGPKAQLSFADEEHDTAASAAAEAQVSTVCMKHGGSSCHD